MKKVSTKKSKSSVYFWQHLAQMRSNIWVTTVVVLAIVVLVLLVVTLPGNGLRSEASGFGSRVMLSNLVKQPVTGTTTSTTGKTPVISGGPTGQTPTPSPTPTTPTPTSNPTTTPPPGGSAGIMAPVASSQWPAWSIQTIRWNYPQASGGIGLKLKKGGQVLSGDAGIIAWPKTVQNPNGTYSTTGGFLRNNGMFEWVIPAGLTTGSGYQVQVTDTQGNILGESGAFTITSAYSGANITAPSSGANVHFGNDVAIQWHAGTFAAHLDVAVFKKSDGYNGLGYIAKNIPASWLYILPNGDGLFTWSVSDNILSQANGNGPSLKVGDQLELILRDADSPGHSIHVPVKIIQ